MPEPQFNVPTVYTHPRLSFGNPGKTPRSPSKAGQTRSPTLFASLFGLGNQKNFKTNNQFALDAVNNALKFPSVSRPPVTDGGNSNFLAQLKNTAGAILANMGSQGDGTTTTVTATPASFSPDQAKSILGDPVVLIGLVLGAGVLIYAVNK